MKKLLTILLSILMVVTIGTVNVLAEGEEISLKGSKTYTVHIETNGGTYTGTNPITASNGSTTIMSLIDDTKLTAPEGKQLDHWSYTTNGESVSDSDTVKSHDGDSIKPVWSDLPITVSFYKEKTDDTAFATTTANDGKVVLPSTDPTKDGYNFVKWVDASDVEVTATTTATKGMKVYAVWVEKTMVSFYADADDVDAFATIEAVDGKVVLPSTDPTKDGYNFVKWVDASDVEVTATTTATKGMKVYADWELIVITVTFDANGGKYGTEDTYITTTSIKDGYLVDVPEDPKWVNHEFIGYKDIENVTEYQFKEETTVLAQWNEIELNVDYDTTYNNTTTDDEALADIEKNGKYTSLLDFELVKGDVDNEELNAITEKAEKNDETIAASCSLTLYKRMWRIHTNKKGKQHYKLVTNVEYPEMENGHVTVEIELPSNLPEIEKGYKRSFYVYSYHNGEVTEIKPVSLKDGKIVFNSSKFSTFAISYRDTKLPTPSPKPTPKKVTYVAPKTGIEG